jgi:hypothetical protein
MVGPERPHLQATSSLLECAGSVRHIALQSVADAKTISR